MPRHITYSQVPVELSIVEFDLNKGEDLFLGYTWERNRGPSIKRTGDGPPYMQLIGGQADEITTHPFGLRLNSWLIQKDDRAKELAEAQNELAKAKSEGAPKADFDVLQNTVKELKKIKAHDSVFKKRYSNKYEILAMQGCGDLTMNDWNVAFLNNPMAYGWSKSKARSKPSLVCIHEETLDRRTYSCLVKWKRAKGRVNTLTIEELKFNRHNPAGDYNNMVSVRHDDKWLPRGESIEFAVSNQQIIRNGQLVPVVTNCHQFGDIRHLLQMPNLNPTSLLFPGDTGRPRDYFNDDQYGDIWLGEKSLIDDQRRNLLRAALSGPILIDIPSGGSLERLRGAMKLTNYNELLSSTDPLLPGDWRLVRSSPTEMLLEIYYRRNTYAWSMLGLSHDNRRFFTLACKGFPGKNGFTLEQAASKLLEAGAWNALLIDEGADVFQMLIGHKGELLETIKRLRRRLRAVFIVARQFIGNSNS